MSNLVNHARTELELQGMLDDSGDFYGGMTGRSVIELMEVFARQGHSGMSAGIVSSLFYKLANFEPLTPLTSDPSDWVEVGPSIWQGRRDSKCFSQDGGMTYYRLGEDRRLIRKLPWALRSKLPERLRQPLHRSEAPK